MLNLLLNFLKSKLTINSMNNEKSILEEVNKTFLIFEDNNISK